MLIKEITATHIDQTITLQGWIVHARSSGKIAFIELRDGSAFIQCVAESKNLGDDRFSQLTSLNIESSLSLTGKVSKHPKKEEYELQVADFHIYGRSSDYPLGQKEHNPDFLFDNRHLYLRSKAQRAIQRIRDTIIHATYDWMREQNFIKIDAPIFTPNACEGTTDLYEVTHINDETMYLSQSGQLYLEAALAAHGRVFDFGPVFRAEKSKTRRHLNEFRMMDAEIAFIQQEENMHLQEDLIFSIIQTVLAHNIAELHILNRDITPLQQIQKPFIRMTYADWVEQLISQGFDVKQGDDIGSDIEMQYCEQISQPMFITNFPSSFKAFYFKQDPSHPGTVLWADLLAPEGCGEIIGGGTREDDYETLLASLQAHGLSIKDFQRYLDTRKYGSIPHAGFGYGLERIVRRVCGLHHIRETIPFPRYANRITP
jgi:asparaginyl-tRNA synthetase